MSTIGTGIWLGRKIYKKAENYVLNRSTIKGKTEKGR